MPRSSGLKDVRVQLVRELCGIEPFAIRRSEVHRCPRLVLAMRVGIRLYRHRIV
jgi:hypothetical protein